MNPTPASPFPQRNPQFPTVPDVIFGDGVPVESQQYENLYRRAKSEEARTLRFQYLAIEEELERAFRYVSPSDQNAATFSLKFAEIIRSAANVYEIVSKALYARFYNDQDQLNVFDYLALDRFLELARRRVTHLAAFDAFPNYPEVSQPFVGLTSWDGNSRVDSKHVPNWWTAYNKIKHSNSGLQSHATLANATASVAAIFMLIERLYGFCILNGGMYQMPPKVAAPLVHPHAPTVPAGRAVTFVTEPRWARLFAIG